jgi:uncharacterized protein (DUF58 family)
VAVAASSIATPARGTCLLCRSEATSVDELSSLAAAADAATAQVAEATRVGMLAVGSGDPFFFSATSGEKSPLLVLQALNPQP